MNRFLGKTAVVTGAARGIGAAIIKKLASEGANVAILDVDASGAEALAAELSQNGAKALAIKCDVSKAGEVADSFNKVIGHFGQLDILVNNAGVLRDNLLFKMTDSDWDTVIDIHLKGAFYCSREAQKYMVAQKSGKIVNLSSTSALGNRGQVNYSSAKAGMQGMTKTMAIELGPYGINVNAIGPGFIETDMTKATAERIGMTIDEMMAGVVKNISIKRPGKPDDIANVAAFLCSEDASYVTGQVIYVAGNPTV